MIKFLPNIIWLGTQLVTVRAPNCDSLCSNIVISHYMPFYSENSSFLPLCQILWPFTFICNTVCVCVCLHVCAHTFLHMYIYKRQLWKYCVNLWYWYFKNSKLCTYFYTHTLISLCFVYMLYRYR